MIFLRDEAKITIESMHHYWLPDSRNLLLFHSFSIFFDRRCPHRIEECFSVPYKGLMYGVFYAEIH